MVFSLLLLSSDKLLVSRRTEKKKQRKHHQLAQLIKVMNTLAILFIVIPELTKFRTIKCLGHLNIVSMPLIGFRSRAERIIIIRYLGLK